MEHTFHTIHMHKYHLFRTVPQFIHLKILFLSTINQQNVDNPFVFQLSYNRGRSCVSVR